jgi:hypothetical protein
VEASVEHGLPGGTERSPRSARDVQLGKALSENSMEVSVKSAALRESRFKVAKLQNVAKTVLAECQIEVQREGIIAMKTCQRAKIQVHLVVELMKAFVAAGRKPADEWRLANAVVSASDGASATGNDAAPDTSGDNME